LRGGRVFGGRRGNPEKLLTNKTKKSFLNLAFDFFWFASSVAKNAPFSQ